MPKHNPSRFSFHSRPQVVARNIGKHYSLNAILPSVFLFVSTLLVTMACDGDRKLNEAINGHLSRIVHNDAQESLDLRNIIPGAWEKVCLGYFPYASRSRIEDEFRGKIIGEFKVVSDSNWLLLGITANNEITQVVLDLEISRYFGDHFRGLPTARSCVSRDQAVIASVSQEGKRFIYLGKP